jgi:hypothetical protein
MVVSSKNSAAKAALLSVVLIACSSSKTTNNAGGTGGSASGTSGSGATGNSTVNDIKPVGTDLQILFSPMYSGYDGSRTFKVPAIVTAAGQAITGAKWSASDISYVDLEDDSETGGVMITTRKAGTVKIIARAGMLSGSSDLTITQFAPGDCDAGDMRYHNSIGIDAGGIALFSGNVPDNASCANCHGDGAKMLSVQHTPQQTGGFSDKDLLNIITKGFKPDGTVFITMIPPQIYQRFHTWDATDPEKTGLLCYLRSIEPKTQGMIDFAGLRPGGGMRGMGGRPGGTAGATAGGAGASAQAGAGGQ